MKYSKIFFILLVLVSFAVRLIFLENIPEGFHHDEASVGYNAYSILKTGRDEYGRFLPLIFEALGDYKLPTVIYTVIPFISVFGLSDFWVRFPTAFFGALTPLALFFLIKKLFSSETVAYFSAFSLAISPWHILFSRSVNESTISVFTAVLAVYFLLSLFERWTTARFLFTLSFTVLTVFTYRTQFIFMPLLLIVLIFLYWDRISGFTFKQKITASAGMIVFLASFLFLTFSYQGSARFKDVGLPGALEIKLILEEQIREDGFQNPKITRLFHNKLINFGVTAARNYFSHFDFSYLFFTGDESSSNNSTPFMGHLLFIDLPFIVVGVFVLLTKRKKKRLLIPLLWLVIGPIASSLTVDSPSALRNLISSVGFSTVVGYGLYVIIYSFKKEERIRQRLFVFLISFLYLTNFIFFVHQFTIHKRVHRPWFRDVGLEELVEYTKTVEKQYKKLVFADYPDLYIFFLYYGKVDPLFIQKQQENHMFVFRKKEMMSFISSKYSFMKKDCISKGQSEVLYICIKDRIPRRATVLKSIRLADNQPIFTFLEFKPKLEEKKETKLPGYTYIENIDQEEDI